MFVIHDIVRHLLFASLGAMLVHANDPMAEVPVAQCQQCGELVEHGIKYGGNGIGSKGNVFSISDCRERCAKKQECKFWTYNNLTSWCYFKTSDRGRQKNSASISGTARCNTSIPAVISATADFTQSNLCGFKAPGLRGYRLENGDFIFSWQRGSRRMVLTDDQGNVKKWGAVQYGVATWQDPSTWITYDNRQYTVSNFRAREFKYSSICNCTEVVENDIVYDGQQLKNVGDVSTMEKCKDLCTSQSGCVVFTYKTTQKMCSLMKSQLNPQTTTGYVSGTPACYGYRSNAL